MAKTYRVTDRGVEHAKGRDEPGETYTGPLKSVDWLLEQGAIEPDNGKPAERDAEGS